MSKRSNIPKVAIVGGGIAGLSAGIELAFHGVEVFIIEKNSYLGGHGIRLSCKADECCQRCGVCGIGEKVKEVYSHPNIEILLNTEVMAIERNERGYNIKIDSSVDQMVTDAIILAIGFEPYIPVEKNLGYGLFSNVISGWEMEKMVRDEGVLKRPSDNKIPKRIAFIQCIGSRKKTAPYCSQICCSYAVRSARSLYFRFGIDACIFYMDIQTFGLNFDKFIDKCKSHIKFIRSMPSEIWENEDGSLQVTFSHPINSKIVNEDFDMVILSNGIRPPKSIPKIEGIDLSFNTMGFLQQKEDNKKGIFIAGTIAGPMSIEDASTYGRHAARSTLQYLEDNSYE